MESINENDRVILICTYANIAKNTIGTIKALTDKEAIILYDYIGINPIKTKIPIEYLRIATVEDLDRMESYKTLIPLNFYNGRKYSINGKQGTIKGIQLALNERFDCFTIHFDSGGETTFERQTLEVEGLLVPDDDDINIIIGNYQFKICNDVILLPTIKANEIEAFTKALNQLNKIFKGDVNHG